jgi:site-specific DNA-methyltransferase (adenine-specific)
MAATAQQAFLPRVPEGRRPAPTPSAAPPHRRSPAVHFSSHTDEWPTPQSLFDALQKEFAFTLDPCATHANAKCAHHFTRAEDGLSQSWADEVVFMNPPYGRQIARWMAKAHGAARHAGATVVCLVPARTDTAWWHQFAMKHEIRFLRGRLKFGDGANAAPFPSALVVMRPAAFALRAGSLESGANAACARR